MSQIDFNAMLASLQQSGQPQPQLPQQQQQQQMGQAMLGNNIQQQQPQSQVQGYPAPLQAAFQQMQNQNQNQNQNQQGFQLPLQNAQQLQQHQNQQQQFQNAMPVPQTQQQNPQLDQQNLAMLLQLRQKGIQLTPDQQAFLSRAMPRRGGIGDVAPGPPFQQQQQGQAQGQMVSPAMGNRQPGGAVPGQMPILPQQQQQQQQNMLAMQQQAPSAQLQQQGQQPGQKMQFPNPQGVLAPGSVPTPGVTVPIPALQEFTSLSEQLRQHMALENHISVCLSQDLAVPLPAPLSSFGASLLDNDQKPVLPPPSAQQGNFARLTPDQRFSLERHREHIRQLAGNAKGRLERLDAQYAGRDNILNSLRAFAAQRSTQPQRTGMVTPVNNAGTTGFQGQAQGQQNTPPQIQQQRAPNQQPQQQIQGVQQVQQQQPMNAYQNQLQKLVQAQQQGGQPQQQQEQPQFNQQQLPQVSQGQFAQVPPILPHQQEFASPNMGPPMQPHPSPNLNTNASMPIQQGQPNPALQAQFLRNQQVAVNEEILKTLNAAGPKTFMKALFDTMKKRDRPIVNVPQVEGSDVDLHKLYRIVQQRGGSAPVRPSQFTEQGES